MRVVALEEHFLTAELAGRAGADSLSASLGREIDTRLLDLGAGRLAAMDEAGIDVQVLSHSSPAAQQLEPAEAMRHARAANDHLARAVAEHPDRFAGFATLPTSDPDAAAEEMHRAVTDLHFVGAMVNSTLGTNGTFLDDARYEPLLAAAEDLDVPLYLHPSEPPSDLHARLYGGFNRETEMFLATAAWGWHAEAGLHALRMVVGGVFERHPGLRMVIGHGGEMLPFMMARIDAILPPERTGLAMRPSEYFLRNVWVTTSGLFSLPPVLCAVQVFGIDRVLFSVDYPYSPNGAGRRLLDMLPMSPADRARIAGGNADRLLGLGAPDAS
jgi:predicted TIM-barrel fold metal-dependent hydrolase